MSFWKQSELPSRVSAALASRVDGFSPQLRVLVCSLAGQRVLCVGGAGQVLWRGTHNKEKDLCAFERKKCPLHICSFKYMQYFIWLEWSEVVWTGLECNLLRYGWGQSSRFVMLFQVRILDEIFDHSHCQNVQSQSQKALIKRIFSRVKRPPDSMERRFPSS